MAHSSHPDVAAVQRIALIPAILETVGHITGLGLTCIARVHGPAWTVCAVFDPKLAGVLPGDMLDVEGGPEHGGATLRGFDSFISVPIRRRDGSCFGALCGVDRAYKDLTRTAALASMTLFAELISQQLSSQQVLEDAQVALLDASAQAELREQFIAVLGHDLRNPLGTIITGAELMLLSLGNAERLTILAKLIQGSGKRMAALVDDVLDLTRGKMGGGIHLNMGPATDLHEVIAQVVDELRSTHPLREIRLDAQESGSVLCDPGRVAQLCSNLLKNALVYGDADAPVAVRLRIGVDACELAVTNHGPRLSDDTIAHLFKPYWRAATKTPHEGLGLGLFIVGEIARAHGGAISVTSTGELTTFLFAIGVFPPTREAAIPRLGAAEIQSTHC